MRVRTASSHASGFALEEPPITILAAPAPAGMYVLPGAVDESKVTFTAGIGLAVRPLPQARTTPICLATLSAWRSEVSESAAAPSDRTPTLVPDPNAIAGTACHSRTVPASVDTVQALFRDGTQTDPIDAVDTASPRSVKPPSAPVVVASNRVTPSRRNS